MAFQTAATHYLVQLTAQHQMTAAGEASALHAMRVALTRLRTCIRFFSPMVAGVDHARLTAELKWLNAHLGMVRDLDVAIERLIKINGQRAVIRDRTWKRERAAGQKILTRALRSQRYRKLITGVTAWIEHGDWSTKTTEKSVARRAEPVAEYSARKLKKWRKALLKKSDKLAKLGAKKRHDVRLANKRVSYAIEAAASLFPESETETQTATLNVLRQAQKALGQLNDDERRRALAASFGEDKHIESELLLKPKQKKQLLRKAVAAYEELAGIAPLKTSST